MVKLVPDGTILGTYRVPPGPRQILFDGEAMWVVSFDSQISRLGPVSVLMPEPDLTLTAETSFEYDPANVLPAVAADQATIWVH